MCISTQQDEITTFGWFHIVEQKKFELMHFIGVPHNLRNGNFSVPDIAQNYFGVRYDYPLVPYSGDSGTIQPLQEVAQLANLEVA